MSAERIFKFKSTNIYFIFQIQSNFLYISHGPNSKYLVSLFQQQRAPTLCVQPKIFTFFIYSKYYNEKSLFIAWIIFDHK